MKKFPWISKDLIGFSLTSLLSDCNHEMTTSLLPLFISTITRSPHIPFALGIIMGCTDAASMCMKLLSGWLADRITRFKPVLLIGYTLTGVFVTLIGTATTLWQVFIYQTLAWVGKGLREPMRDVWLTAITSPKNYGKSFGLQRACDTIGAIAGPTIAFFTIHLFALRYNFFIAFIPGVLAVVTVAFLTSNYQKPSRNQTPFSWKNSIKHLPRPFTYFTAIMFLFGIANFNKVLLIYRAQEMLLHQTNSSLLASSWAILLYILFNIIRACSELSIGSLSDYINPKYLLSFFGCGLFALTSVLLLFAQGQLALWVVIFITAGCSTGALTAVEKAYAAQLLPENVRGTGFGLLQSIDGVGDLLSSAIVGFLWTFVSPEIAFIYSTALSICSALLLLGIRK